MMSSTEESKSIPISRKRSTREQNRLTTEDSSDDEEDKYKSAMGSLEKISLLMHSELPPVQSETAMDGCRANETNGAAPEQDSKPEDDQRLSLFSMSMVSQKLIDIYTSAKERVWGEEYWVPTDPTVIVPFPLDALRSYQRLLPQDDNLQSAVFAIHRRSDDESALYHVTFTATPKNPQQSTTLSISRSNDIHAATDIYQSCILCGELFAQLDANDINGINKLLEKIRHHPLWQAVHIAARMGNVEYFIEKQKEGGDKLKMVLSMVSHPEGLYPLLIAIQNNMVDLVDKLLEMGADPSVSDVNSNNAMHYAALVSSSMLETLWKYEATHDLINQTNADGCTPLFVAIRNGGPLCTSTLVHFGGALNARFRGNSPLFEAMLSKGTTVSVLESLLKASPDSLTERDPLTGNSPLHVAQFKQPLVALLQLHNDKLDINAVNSSGQTALHVNAHRGNLGCIFSLAACGINLDLQDDNGDTALHVAVSKTNVVMTRALLCLGASVNIKNRHGDTPRHLASKLPLNDRKDLLRSLVICGAERCDMDKVGCRSGCAHDRLKMGMVHSISSAVTMRSNDSSSDTLAHELLHDEPVEDDASIGATSVDEEFLEDLAGKEPAVKDAPTHSFRQGICYESVRKRAEKCLKEGGQGASKMINLLSLDGGGIRGLVTIQILLALEKMLGDRVYDYFDWVAGTSTGSYVAAGLAQGRSLRECQHIYLRFKDSIFEFWTRPYTTEVVEKFMQEELGADCTMADVRWPRLMIATVRCDVFPVKLEFFRNYSLPITEEENKKLGFFPPSEVKLWKALRCSSAAPTFFSNVDGQYIDGGLIANNPAMDLLAETHLWNTALQYTDQQERDQVTIGCLLSIGTGVLEPQPMNMLDLNLTLIANPFSVAAAMKNLGVILLDQVMATEGAPVSRSRSWCHSLGVPYFRLCAPLSQDVQLDSKNDVEIAQMMWEAVEYAFAHKKEMMELVELLRLLGKSEHRRHLFTDVETGSRDMQTQTSVTLAGAADVKPSFTLN